MCDENMNYIRIEPHNISISYIEELKKSNRNFLSSPQRTCGNSIFAAFIDFQLECEKHHLPNKSDCLHATCELTTTKISCFHIVQMYLCLCIFISIIVIENIDWAQFQGRMHIADRSATVVLWTTIPFCDLCALCMCVHMIMMNDKI